MSSDGIKAKSFLRISAMLVPVGEDDIFDPTALNPERGMQISSELVSENCTWNLV